MAIVVTFTAAPLNHPTHTPRIHVGMVPQSAEYTTVKQRFRVAVETPLVGDVEGYQTMADTRMTLETLALSAEDEAHYLRISQIILDRAKVIENVGD